MGKYADRLRIQSEKRLAAQLILRVKYGSRVTLTRDVRNIEALKLQGCSVLELWECDVSGLEGIEEKLRFTLQKS